jgi:hypothetical protein
MEGKPVTELETWIEKALWLYRTCVVQFGSDPVCKEAYALGALVAVGIIACLLFLLARRSFRAWREMKSYEQYLLARRQSAPPDVMKKLERPSSRTGPRA